MPEPDGNTLPSEQTHFNLQGIEGREKPANELLDLGLLGLNRIDELPFAIEASTFRVANMNYQHAVECYRYGLYDAAMVMARATVDAALYSSKYSKINEINNFDKKMGGSLGSQWTSKGLRSEGQWPELKIEAERLSLNMDDVNEIRDEYGNFSAHNLARQMQELHEYTNLSEKERETAKKPKFFIDAPKAYSILKKTAIILARIRRVYAESSIKIVRGR